MNHWQSLLDEGELAELLPAEHREFAPAVVGALAVFLDGLSEARQVRVLARQAELGPHASASERIGALAHSSPVLHKLGQILARDSRLAPALRHQLEKLESLPPAIPVDELRPTLSQDLGVAWEREIELAETPLAEASVAVVVPFRQKRPRPSALNARFGAQAAHADPREAAEARRCDFPGVLKILKPGIEQQLGEELALLGRVGDYLDDACGRLGLIQLDYAESFRRVQEKLAGEVRLDREQTHLLAARREFLGEPRVLIPALLPYSSPRITAMQRVFGRKITERLPSETSARRRLARLVAAALVARPIFAPQARAVFHSDPHAGNLMLADDGRLAILDWSLVGELTHGERAAIVQMLLAAAALDETRIADLLASLAERGSFAAAAVRVVVRRWLGKIIDGTLPAMAWLVGMLDDAVQTAGLRVHAELMLFRKSLYTVEGVVASIGGGAVDVDGVLTQEFARQLALEMPARWFAAPASRDFATRASNLDLLALYLQMPKLAAFQTAAAGRRLWAKWVEPAAPRR
ncbi:MAG: phosphotransferase [Pirellulales bacterium]|nr:phosphotransferase [Pirellulales bacterium]